MEYWIVRSQTAKHHFVQKGLLPSPAMTSSGVLEILIGLHNTKQGFGIVETTGLYLFFYLKVADQIYFWATAAQLEQEKKENVLEHLH